MTVRVYQARDDRRPAEPNHLGAGRGYQSVLGVFWGSWIERDGQGHRANTEQLLTWCVEGKLSSHLHAVYPLSEIVTAMKLISDRKVMGKIVLRP